MSDSDDSDSSVDSDDEARINLKNKTKTITMPKGTILYHIAPTEHFNMKLDETPIDGKKREYYFGESLSLCVKATWHRQRGKTDEDVMWLFVFRTTQDLKLLQQINPTWRMFLIDGLNAYCNELGVDGWHLKDHMDNSIRFYNRYNKGISFEEAEYETALFEMDKLESVGKQAFTLSALKNHNTVVVNEDGSGMSLSSVGSTTLRF